MQCVVDRSRILDDDADRRDNGNSSSNRNSIEMETGTPVSRRRGNRQPPSRPEQEPEQVVVAVDEPADLAAVHQQHATTRATSTTTITARPPSSLGVRDQQGPAVVAISRDDDEDPSIVILNPFWARTPEDQKPRLTVKTAAPPPSSAAASNSNNSGGSSSSATAARKPPPPPPRPVSTCSTASLPTPPLPPPRRRPLPPASISSELLLLSQQVPPDWSDLITMSVLPMSSATTSPGSTVTAATVDETPDGGCGAARKLTSQGSNSSTRRPLVKQKKHYQSAEDLAAAANQPAVTINVSAASRSPFTCPLLPSPPASSIASSAAASVSAYLPTTGASDVPPSSSSPLPPLSVSGRFRTCSFEDEVNAMADHGGRTGGGGGRAAADDQLATTSSSGGGHHHLKPSSCGAPCRTRSPSPSTGMRSGATGALLSGGGGVASDVSTNSSCVGAGDRLRRLAGGSARQSRQQSVESRASSSIPTGHHQLHHPGSASGSSSKTGPIEDGAPLPAAFEPVPLNLYGKPLREIDPTVRDKVGTDYSTPFYSSHIILLGLLYL